MLGGCGDVGEQSPDSQSNMSPEELRASAEQGDAEAQYILGAMYYMGQGVPQDYAEEVKWYRLSADQGHAAAQYNLGVSYHRGQGVPQDYVEAMKWYRLAADQGYAEAQYNLGLMYGKGEGVPQDYVEAYAWLSVVATGYTDLVKVRDIAASELTPEQLSQAQQRATELFEKIQSSKE